MLLWGRGIPYQVQGHDERQRPPAGDLRVVPEGARQGGPLGGGVAVQVDLEGLAKALDRMRDELEPVEGIDHRAGYLYTAAECLRQAEKLERQNTRLKELYESAMAIVRRLQGEREGLIDRVERALRGIAESEV